MPKEYNSDQINKLRLWVYNAVSQEILILWYLTKATRWRKQVNQEYLIIDNGEWTLEKYLRHIVGANSRILVYV